MEILKKVGKKRNVKQNSERLNLQAYSERTPKLNENWQKQKKMERFRQIFENQEKNH